MREEIAEVLADYTGGEIRSNYSGRGMYGEQTFGVVVDNDADLFEAVAAIARELEPDEYPDTDFKFRTDGMGLSTIIY